MSKAERLNERVNELLAAAVQRVLDAVRDAVLEHEEKSARAQRENATLRRRVEQLEEQLDTAASLKKPCLGDQSNLLESKDKPCFKEEPRGDRLSAVLPAEIKTELEHADYLGAEEPVQEPMLEPVLHNTYFPCAHLQFQASQNEPDFPVVPPCNNTNNTAAAADTLDTFVEHFPFEEDGWRQQSREERHVCLLCGKNFNRLANLRIHQRCHTGEKPYSCSHCGRRFSHSGNLQKHKRVHTGERPYQCPQCSKSFCQSSHLKKHQTVHVGRHGTVARRNMEL